MGNCGLIKSYHVNYLKPLFTSVYIVEVKMKDKVHPKTGHERAEGEQRYSSALSLTSSVDGRGWSTPRPGRFTPGKDAVPIRHNHNIKIHNKSSQMAEQFKCLGTTIMNQNNFHEEITSIMKSGNGCHYSVQKFLSSDLLSENIKIKTYRIIILPVVSLRVWNLFAPTGGGKQSEGVRE
jgi:hypothetical protein